jgi:hypothetical protein
MYPGKIAVPPGGGGIIIIITENFSNDIGMSFGIDKCKTQSICRGHYENLE